MCQGWFSVLSRFGQGAALNLKQLKPSGMECQEILTKSVHRADRFPILCRQRKLTLLLSAIRLSSGRISMVL